MEILWLLALIVLSVLFISSVSILLYHLRNKLSKSVKSIKKNLIKYLDIVKSCKQKNKMSKNNVWHEKKLRTSVKKFVCFISNIADEPEWMLIIASVSFLAILVIITKLSIIPVDIKNIANMIFAFACFIIFILIAIKLAKDNSFLSKIQSLFLLIVYIISFALLPIIVFSKHKINPEKNIIAFLVFFSVILFSVIIAIKYYNRKMAVLLVIGAYCITIFVGAIAFGEYYWNNYPYKFSEYILQINKTENIWMQIMIVIKMGISGFFEFPSQDILCKLSFFQFMIGKIMEIVLLGYVAAQLLNVKNSNEFN